MVAGADFHGIRVLHRRPDGGLELVPTGPVHRAAAVAALFGVLLAGRRPGRTG